MRWTTPQQLCCNPARLGIAARTVTDVGPRPRPAGRRITLPSCSLAWTCHPPTHPVLHFRFPRIACRALPYYPLPSGVGPYPHHLAITVFQLLNMASA